MKAALYLRVSTGHGRQTTDNQRLELEAYCERQGWNIVKIYDDTGISGSKGDRPGLNNLMKDAAKKRFDVVVVWKIDRLARSTVHLLSVLQTLQSSGIGFVATTQTIDTTTAYGKMVTTFLAAIAEFERSLVIERVKAGQSRARSEGIKIGRPRVAIDIKTALELRNQGLGYKQIAKTLGVPRTTVYRTLKAIPQTPAEK